MTTAQYNKAARELSNRLYRYVLKCLGDRETARDIVQDCYMKLWSNRKKVPFEKAKPWLFTTAHNTLINHVKKQKRMVSSSHMHNNESQTAGGVRFELREIIDRSLAKLPEVQKSIVLLRDLEGYNYKEIGQMLDLNESQVKVYLFRARKKIKKDLKGMDVFS